MLPIAMPKHGQSDSKLQGSTERLISVTDHTGPNNFFFLVTNMCVKMASFVLGSWILHISLDPRSGLSAVWFICHPGEVGQIARLLVTLGPRDESASTPTGWPSVHSRCRLPRYRVWISWATKCPASSVQAQKVAVIQHQESVDCEWL